MCKHDCGVALYPPPEVGGFTASEDKGEGVWLCMTRPEEHIDPSKILAWQPMNEPSNDFFESLQPDD